MNRGVQGQEQAQVGQPLESTLMEFEKEMTRRYHAHDQLLAQNQALAKANERLMEAAHEVVTICEVFERASSPKVIIKLLRQAIAAAEKEQDQ